MNFQNIEFEFAAGRPDQLPPSDLPEIVFSGRSNVGKSTLLNRLVNRKALARVSATPGKTATINFYKLSNCRFVDLPGYGYAKVSKGEKDRWAALVEGFFAQERQIALVVQLIDMRHKPTADDLHMIDFLIEIEMPFVVVCTKSDKLNKSETAAQMVVIREALDNGLIPFYPVSAVKGNGLSELRDMIAESIGE